LAQVVLAVARRGIVGIESAIVLIAFVIVAAALAFVVLNMGFFTSQQSKLVMQRGLGEASSALELDGTFVAAVNTTAQNIVYAWAPVKLSSGQHKVDLTPTKTIVSYWSPDKGLTITNAYLIAILTPITNTSKIPEIVDKILGDSVTVSGAKGTVDRITVNVGGIEYTVYVGLPEDVTDPRTPVSNLLKRYASDKVIVILNWVVRVNDDLVLDPGEKVVFFVYYRDESVRPDGYDLIKIEVKVPIGAPLTIERMIPPSLTQPVVDLG
jgi:flagellin FlaB